MSTKALQLNIDTTSLGRHASMDVCNLIQISHALVHALIGVYNLLQDSHISSSREDARKEAWSWVYNRQFVFALSF